MLRPLASLALLGAAALPFAPADGPTDKELASKPVTTIKGELGDLLRAWYKHDLAAGHVGDWYDNRDGEHSPLEMSHYPQLRKVPYSDDDRKARKHWAWQRQVLPHVTFGNSSTAAPATSSGSNPRSFYCTADGPAILERQYLGNNLYIYPEHQDHDPGHNGQGGGYGDLFPANTPYLIISQGSSGSDQPFMRGVAAALAAFRPAVKKKLIEAGLLMPTVQMIFRWTNSHLKGPGDYLTAKAHPSAFEPGWVDPLKMARMAQSVRLNTIPPLVKLKVVEEDKPQPGRDYCDRPGATEALADTSGAIARVWRGQQYKRRMVVSAKGSLDVNKAPLKFTWVLLRGDAKRVTITPRGKAGDEAEIVVSYHERRPVAPGAALASNRVDIAAFAHNGTFYSAPAFVTFFTLDSESRAYDDKGRIVEIAHGMGAVELSLADPAGALAELGRGGLAAKVLGLTAAQRADLAEVAKRAAAPSEALAAARKAGQDGRAEQEALAKVLDARREALGAGARPFVLEALRRAARRPAMWNDHAAELGPLAAKAAGTAAVRQGLSRLGVARAGPGHSLVMQPIRQGPGKEADRLTPFERSALEWFHAVVLADVVLPKLVGVQATVNFVDPRLSPPRPWRDVFRHDGDALAGWTRYYLTGKTPVTEHTAEGWLVAEKDARGRAVKARPASYVQGPPRKGAWVNDTPLLMAVGNEVITISYEGGRRAVKREKAGKP